MIITLENGKKSTTASEKPIFSPEPTFVALILHISLKIMKLTHFFNMLKARLFVMLELVLDMLYLDYLFNEDKFLLIPSQFSNLLICSHWGFRSVDNTRELFGPIGPMADALQNY